VEHVQKNVQLRCSCQFIHSLGYTKAAHTIVGPKSTAGGVTKGRYITII